MDYFPVLSKITRNKFNIETFLFKEQLDFVTDPARFATAVCSVRAGKTTSCAADLIDTALKYPGTISIYITLARSSAKRIIWPELQKINRDYSLGFEENIAELSFKSPKGSMIYLMGGNVESEIEKVRGLSNVALVYIDESQAFRTHIQELVEDIVVKRLYDTNGRCRLIGTPGPIPAGYFYDCANSPKWAHHVWTLHQNPWLERKSGKTATQLIQQDMDRKGVTVEDPSIQRECFGRWVLDTNSLLLNYNAEINHYEELPIANYTYILGVDLGHTDADSLSLLAFTKSSPTTYLIDEIITHGQLTDQLAMQIKGLMRVYPIGDIVGDAGGLGKKVIEDIKDRYTIPIEPADKRDKMSNYKFLDNALRTGNFKAKKTSRFAQDCNILERDLDKSTSDRIKVKGHSDAVDSALYAFKLSPAYNYTPPIKKTQPGTPEFIKEQEEQHIKALMDKVKREKEIRENKGGYGAWNKDKKGIADWNKW
jgi:hypothetical protein